MRLCEELFASEFLVEDVVYCRAALSSERAQRLLDMCRKQTIAVDEISEGLLRKICDTVQPQGVLAVAQKPRAGLEQLLPRGARNLIMLDHIQDPGNLGTILRTAAWFGIDGLLLSKHCVDWSNPKAVRASMGAVFHVPVLDDIDLPNTLLWLQEQGSSLFLVDVAGETSVYEAEFDRKNIFLFGGETRGVQASVKKLAKTSLKIPRAGTGDSLNVAVAAGVILSELSRRGDLE